MNVETLEIQNYKDLKPGDKAIKLREEEVPKVKMMNRAQRRAWVAENRKRIKQKNKLDMKLRKVSEEIEKVYINGYSDSESIPTGILK